MSALALGSGSGCFVAEGIGEAIGQSLGEAFGEALAGSIANEVNDTLSRAFGGCGVPTVDDGDPRAALGDDGEVELFYLLDGDLDDDAYAVGSEVGFYFDGGFVSRSPDVAVTNGSRTLSFVGEGTARLDLVDDEGQRLDQIRLRARRASDVRPEGTVVVEGAHVVEAGVFVPVDVRAPDGLALVHHNALRVGAATGDARVRLAENCVEGADDTCEVCTDGLVVTGRPGAVAEAELALGDHRQLVSFRIADAPSADDAGVPDDDAGTRDEDAGLPDDDAGTRDDDGGVPDEDAGLDDEDAGLDDEDARLDDDDAGVPDEDAGPPSDDG